MSWAFCETKHIKKTRKLHMCEFCFRIIPSGSPNIYHWSGLFDGEFQNSYACHWCEKHKDHLVDWDNEILDVWDCLIDDIFWEELKQYRPVYGRSDGDYFVFYSHETGEEVWRVKCPTVISL